MTEPKNAEALLSQPEITSQTSVPIDIYWHLFKKKKKKKT